MNFGHYTAYGKNSVSGTWYEYNDSMVSEVDDPSEMISGAAYVLFYKQRSYYPDNQEVDFQKIRKIPILTEPTVSESK